MEKFISGYCRALDKSRMVCVEKEVGEPLQVDCAYANCPYTGQCVIAQQISQIEEQG